MEKLLGCPGLKWELNFLSNWHFESGDPICGLLCLAGFFPLHPMMITDAERLRRKQAHEVLLASQETDAEATDTEATET
ncbi:37S ribosomal protein S16, mitochondrial [Saguinus oedipus]|uniref:37S ribosomal protein S16, mitochondrial n=1 Tax=Saguinus oedipus TaxID=9490 RepID=A0ABQ9UHV1_SAGOE|nr:37S ribosomal protein S16, mitochondrial [Saguinus oedipus]